MCMRLAKQDKAYFNRYSCTELSEVQLLKNVHSTLLQLTIHMHA